MASTTWRMTGIQTHGGGYLELSELRLWSETSALDGAGVTLRSSHPPTSGSLENLRDDDFDTTCRWSAEIVQSPGFYIEWETPTAVFAWCVRLAAPLKEVSVGEYSLNMLSPTGWLCAENGWLEYQAGLSDAREVRPVYGVPVGWWQPTGPVAGTLGFTAAATSADGQKIVVGGRGTAANKVSISNDGGLTWTQSDGPSVGTGDFEDVATSADGQKIVVCGFGNSANKVSISNDGGLTWAQPISPWAGSSRVVRTDISDDGLTIVVCGYGDNTAPVSIFTSSDPMYVDPLVTHRAQPQLALPSTTPPAPQGLGPTNFYRPLKALDAEFGGKGRIYGTVTRKNLPANIPMKRRVRLHRSVDGLLVRETWSDTAGNYEFREINPRYEYDVFAWDHEMMFRTVVANNLKPEV